MDIDTVRQVVTVVSFLAFIGVIWFAVHPGNKQRFEEAARLPIDDLGEAPAGDRIQLGEAPAGDRNPT